ncbi:MAG: DNA polymerase III subunit alpha, partial [Gemmatimonadota bacterium]
LRLVERHGLAGFFLVYRDIMELAREVAARVRGSAPRADAGLPPGRGRGSSVSSIICYLIGLSHVDPVEADLFLGRFLNQALGSVPDIDLDFPRDIREELILAVYDKYGTDHAGLVCTFPTYRFKSAVRELGKILDLPGGDMEKLTKLGGGGSAAALREELERIPEFRDRAHLPPWSHLAELAEEIAGLPRHISQHVGGMIISSRPLLELVPLEPAAMEGRVLCQWDKDSCDDAGFIKIDFLALGMLSLVEEAADLIAERRGAPPDLSRIDFEDDAVYDRICSGDTVGLFQVESRAQIQMLRRVRPRNLKELAIQVAIVRPGPIVGGAVNPYVRRRELQREDPEFEIPYDHPLLADALEETLGVIIYQDQVLEVCRDLAGFTDGQAEGLRRAMSRKRSRDAMEEYWNAFLRGARERGVDETTARTVFRQVVAFSEFGFPKSHAAAFGLLAYQSAWLRHYHPVEYYVALFNNQPMGFYSLDALGRDARRNGVSLLLPDVNRSDVRCTVELNRIREAPGPETAAGAGRAPRAAGALRANTEEKGALRVGLGFVRGWGEEICERVVEERERGGPYRSLLDFLRRTPAALKRPAIENLIWVGGFDSFGLTRRELLWQVGLWLGPESDPDRVGGRNDHPQIEMELENPSADLPFPDLDATDRMVAEYRTLRFATSAHPFSLFADRLPPGTVTSKELAELPDGATVTVAGIVTARQRPQTAKGYTFVLLDDEYGSINSIVKPRIYEKHRATVRMEPFIVVRGRLQKDGDTINVIAFQVWPLRLEEDGAEASSGSAPGPRGEPVEMPPAHEWWGPGKETGAKSRWGSRSESRSEGEAGARGKDRAGATRKAGSDPFRFLTALRQTPPGVKNWG